MYPKHYTVQRSARWIAACLFAILLRGALASAAGAPADMARIPGGLYRPLYSGADSSAEVVPAFLLDRYPVTNADFAKFVASHPAWAVGRPPAIKADRNYLRHWQSGRPAPELLRMPVTSVSWFAAREYCRARGKRLPLIAEWEVAAMAPDAARPHEGEEALTRRILAWYSRPNELRVVGTVYKNVYGVYDLHGSVWEWTEDFNSVTIDSDSREKGQSDKFCGAGGFNSSNPRDYAAFMRQAFRSGLTAASTTQNLGFRCAADSAGK
jgi:formylglycine-generating enzyme required for sulfatase activity